MKKVEQEIQLTSEKIQKSEYWRYYKLWTPELEGEKYGNDKTSGELKEAWARIRTGNIYKKARKACAECAKKREIVTRIWIYRKSMK